jgi:hypothetical protein
MGNGDIFANIQDKHAEVPVLRSRLAEKGHKRGLSNSHTWCVIYALPEMR